MEFRYERDLANAYMVLQARKENPGYQKRMILENRMQGFLPVQSRWHDGEEEYYYCVSSKISLEEYLEHDLLKELFLKQLIFTICQAVSVLDEYLLTEDWLLLDPEAIYIQEDSTFVLCAYPDEKQDVREELRQLFKYLMGKTDPADEGCAALCYEMYGLLQKDNFCLREFMTVLERSAIPEPAKEPQKKKWTKQLFASRRNSGIM